MTLQVYAQRRARLAAALQASGGGVAVWFTAPERARNADSHYAYRHDSSFYYLCGFDEPESCLVLDAQGRSTLFCRPRDEEREIWDGLRLGPQAAVQTLGVDAAHSIADLDQHLSELLANQPQVWCSLSDHEMARPAIDRALQALRVKERMGIAAPAGLRELSPLIDDMRLFKDGHELGLMRRAGSIAAAAHRRAMHTARAGLREYELEAEILHEFRKAGASGPAYNTIVATGANACILHYAAGPTELRDGELCLIDAGCEFGSYASDITRTFPVNGRFSPAQRDLYDLVVAAQEAAIASTRPGVRKIDTHWEATRVLAQGMLDLKLLDANAVGTLDDVMASAAYRRFYMHGTGHWLGLDVHDAGDVLQRDESPIEQPDGLGGRVVKHPSRVLREGMVLTIEPGLYVRAGSDVDEKYWNIGIRIEDDAIVTAQGCELITREVPVRAKDIEALMAERPTSMA